MQNNPSSQEIIIISTENTQMQLKVERWQLQHISFFRLLNTNILELPFRFSVIKCVVEWIVEGEKIHLENFDELIESKKIEMLLQIKIPLTDFIMLDKVIGKTIDTLIQSYVKTIRQNFLADIRSIIKIRLAEMIKIELSDTSKYGLNNSGMISIEEVYGQYVPSNMSAPNIRKLKKILQKIYLDICLELFSETYATGAIDGGAMGGGTDTWKYFWHQLDNKLQLCAINLRETTYVTLGLDVIARNCLVINDDDTDDILLKPQKIKYSNKYLNSYEDTIKNKQLLENFIDPEYMNSLEIMTRPISNYFLIDNCTMVHFINTSKKPPSVLTTKNVNIVTLQNILQNANVVVKLQLQYHAEKNDNNNIIISMHVRNMYIYYSADTVQNI